MDREPVEFPFFKYNPNKLRKIKFIPAPVFPFRSTSEIIESDSYLNRIEKLANRISFKNSPFKIEVKANHSGIVLVSHVPDRDTGQLIHVFHSIPVMMNNLSDEQIIQIIEDGCKQYFIHEFYESFHVDGKRYKDPI